MPCDKQSIIDINAKFASTFTGAENPSSKPTKGLAILTCMDTWINEADAFGIALGQAHIIRNAGASAKDGFRSLIISQQLLDTDEVWVIKHTRCGMIGKTNEEIHGIIQDNIGVSAEHIDFLPFEELVQAVRDDVKWLKAQPLIPEALRGNILGWVLDLNTGKLQEVI